VVGKIPRRHKEHKVSTRRIFITFVICNEICYLSSYSEIKLAEAIVEENVALIIEKWNDFFSKN
jgi:hypothetical protein